MDVSRRCGKVRRHGLQLWQVEGRDGEGTLERTDERVEGAHRIRTGRVLSTEGCLPGHNTSRVKDVSTC